MMARVLVLDLPRGWHEDPLLNVGKGLASITQVQT